jgi:hypothetical protein
MLFAERLTGQKAGNVFHNSGPFFRMKDGGGHDPRGAMLCYDFKCDEAIDLELHFAGQILAFPIGHGLGNWYGGSAARQHGFARVLARIKSPNPEGLPSRLLPASLQVRPNQNSRGGVVCTDGACAIVLELLVAQAAPPATSCTWELWCFRMVLRTAWR